MVNEEVQEYVGIFKDYSPQLLQVMDVSYQDSNQIRLWDIVVPREPMNLFVTEPKLHIARVESESK
ncbi:hypothetical protein ACFLXU_06460, partial [Chloroflexota bacterium]